MAATATAGALSSLVSLLLSLILPFTMLSSALPAGESVTVTSALSVQEEMLRVEAGLSRTEEGELSASFAADVNGERAGIAFGDGQLHMLRGEASLTMEEYILYMERALENGLFTPSDLDFYKELLALEPVFSYLTDGRAAQDADALLTVLQYQMPRLTQLLGVRTAALENNRTQYSFTLHLRDLPAALINLALRVLVTNHSVIDSLHVWDVMENAPACGTNDLLLMLSNMDMELDDLPALTLPVDVVLGADGNLESLKESTVYYADDESVEIDVMYADNLWQAAIHPYDEDDVPQGMMEITASIDKTGGMIDYVISDGDMSQHWFVNYELRNGALQALDAQCTYADYHSYTVSLSYAPRSLSVTGYSDDGVLTGKLGWFSRNGVLQYWADVTVADSYAEEAYTANASGTVNVRGDFHHKVKISLDKTPSDERTELSFEQKLTQEDNTYIHDVTGTVTQPAGEIIPVSWNTVITLN